MNRFLLTMQYEEDFLLPIFLQHYNKYFPRENIFIVDHGSRDNLVPAGYNRIYVPRTRGFSEQARQHLIRNLTQGLLKYYDYGVFADCDELIALDNFDETIFKTQPEVYVAGFEVFWRIGQRAKSLSGLINPSECKPLIFTRMPLWSMGFHSSASCTPNVLTVPMAHIRFLHKEEATTRLSNRKTIYEHMNAEEKRGGELATHWATGNQNLQDFHLHVERFDQRRIASQSFKMIDPQLIFSLTPQTLSDGRQVVVPVANSDWRFLPDIDWDLSAQFPNLSL